jgi:transposase
MNNERLPEPLLIANKKMMVYLSVAELGDPRRFNNERQLSNYIGLVPGIYQSDETSKPIGLTPRSRSLLRSYFIEAAWVALRRNPEMQSYYRKHIGKNQKPS